MGRELRGDISSQPHLHTEDSDVQSMIDKLGEVKANQNNHSTGGCDGNISAPCIQDGIAGASHVAEEYGTEHAIIGGVGTQLRALADSEDPVQLMRYFGNRTTNDIDILVPDQRAARRQRDTSSYTDVAGRPALDFLDDDQIPSYEDVLNSARKISFDEIDDGFSFSARVPSTEELLYTKVVETPGSRQSGTQYDVGVMMYTNGHLFDFEEDRVYQKLEDRLGTVRAAAAKEYLLEAEADIGSRFQNSYDTDLF